MSTQPFHDLCPGRLAPQDYATRFAETTPPLKRAQAALEAERCLYCFDAPCVTACPTAIDVPAFIRRIADGNLRGAAHTILEANPLGGTCARVCPTETLCEAACVRSTQEDRPVAIGRLQAHAVDALLASQKPQIFTRAPATGLRVAVVGAGPAGLSCAHTLARLGHQVVVVDAASKPGGLNEYGLARYKTPDGFAQREVQWLLDVGGITLQTGWRLHSSAQLQALRAEFDAVFLGLGLAHTRHLNLPGEELAGVEDAVAFIARLRQCADLSTLPVGRRVIVIGGGMTAIDAAVQSKLLGASVVHMVYRRGPETMGATRQQCAFAQTRGVVLHHWLKPVELQGQAGHVCAVRFVQQTLVDGQLQATGRELVWEADMVLKAIGQTLGNPVLQDCGLKLDSGCIATDASGATNLPGVWAGGDCRADGPNLTVQAVEHGKQSARAIHAYLCSKAAPTVTPIST